MHGKEEVKALYSNSRGQITFYMQLQQRDGIQTLKITLINAERDQLYQTVISQAIVFECNKKHKTQLYPEGIFEYLQEHFDELKFSPQGDIIFQYGHKYKQQQRIILHKKSNIALYLDLKNQIFSIHSFHYGQLSQLKHIRDQLVQINQELLVQKEELRQLREYRPILSRSEIRERMDQMQDKSIYQCHQLLNQTIFHHLFTNNEYMHSKFQAQVSVLKKRINQLQNSVQVLTQMEGKMKSQCRQLIKEEMEIFIQDNEQLRQQIKQMKMMETQKGQLLKKSLFNQDILQIHPNCQFASQLQLQKRGQSLIVMKRQSSYQDTYYSKFMSKLAIKKGQLIELNINIKATKQYNIQIGICSNDTTTQESPNLMYFLWDFMQKRKTEEGPVQSFFIKIDTIQWTIKLFANTVFFHQMVIPELLRSQTLHPAISIFDHKDAIELGFTTSSL